MSRLSSKVKVSDLANITQTNGDIFTAVGFPDTNLGILILMLSKCNIRSTFRQLKGKVVIIIRPASRGGPLAANLTTLFDKVKFFYLVVVVRASEHNYTRPIFGECG